MYDSMLNSNYLLLSRGCTMTNNEILGSGRNTFSPKFINIKKAINFRYKWRINNFDPNCRSLESPTFSDGTSNLITWRMRLEDHTPKPFIPGPYGSYSIMPSMEETIYCVKLFLLSSNVVKIEAICNFQLLSAIPKNTITWKKRLEFTHGKCLYCFDKNKRDFLNPENGFVQNGNVTLTCEINAAMEISIPRTISKSALDEDLVFQFKNLKLTDVTFCISGKEFQVHKTVLAARSPVFKAMFEDEMEKFEQHRIEITDVDGEVFGEILRYIYTGRVFNMEKIAIDLLVAADKFRLPSLKELCEEDLCSNISIENVVENLILADLHKLDQLKAVAISYIGIHAVEVSKTTEWNSFIQSHPHLFIEVLCDVSTQLKVLTG